MSVLHGLTIFAKNAPLRGSHLPVLFKMLSVTSGAVLELGGGMYSTPFLHWACFHDGRRLVTVEQDRRYERYLMQFSDPTFHQVIFVNSYDDFDLSESWSVAFADHSPCERRVVDIARLTHADYVVAHDADGWTKGYDYPSIFPLFKYQWRYVKTRPSTIVFSNKFPFDARNTLGEARPSSRRLVRKMVRKG
jgi:hypothetical protein